MKQTELIMGMPITVEIIGNDTSKHFKTVFDYFRAVDARYSTYKPDSEISRINDGLPEDQWSEEMKVVLELCEETKRATKGFFDIHHHGKRDPSGLVKGWAIDNAAAKLRREGALSFYIEAGGDIQTSGHNADDEPWRVGIRNPFAMEEIVKSVQLSGEGVATSGTYIRGQHIYNPKSPHETVDDVCSLTVVGPNIYEADRFATAAYAMGIRGIDFIAATPGLEGYMIDADKVATFTNGFERYVYDA
jgi:thiamine biosynthesis lipoprotein